MNRKWVYTGLHVEDELSWMMQSLAHNGFYLDASSEGNADLYMNAVNATLVYYWGLLCGMPQNIVYQR